MFLSPIRSTDPPDRRAWDNCTLWDDGRFYAFFNTRYLSEEPDAYGLDIAVSDNGVSWRWIGRDLVPIEGAHAGYGLIKIQDTFFYYPTCSHSDADVHFKIYESEDCAEWSYLGNNYDVYPDQRYYRARWDELCILKDSDIRGAVYYGYISAEVNEVSGSPGLGMLESRDGRRWEVLPPPVIDWGGLPAQHMEVNFCEKINGTYYLSMSGRLYMDSLGYSLYTFTSDSPSGPFQPDITAFRLCGASSRDVTWLGHPVHTPSALLIALWFSSDQTLEIPSRNLSIGPLLKLTTSDGHLRLEYWKQNDVAKGKRRTVDTSTFEWLHPEPYDRAVCREIGGNGAVMKAGRNGMLLVIQRDLDLSAGFILEGALTVTESRRGVETHHLPARAGFVFGTDIKGSCPRYVHRGYAIVFETLGVTKGGTLACSDSPIIDNDRYRYAGSWLADHRSGEFEGTTCFTCDDTVGPFGHASFGGVRHGSSHAIRLICRAGFAMVFVDEMYVQTYVVPASFDGTLAMTCFDGTCEIRDIALWDIDLGADN